MTARGGGAPPPACPSSCRHPGAARGSAERPRGLVSAKQDNKINGSFIYQRPGSSLQGCRIQFSCIRGRKSSLRFPGTTKLPAGWGCPFASPGGSSATAAHAGTSAAAQPLPFLFPPLPSVTAKTQARAHPPGSIISPPQRTSKAVQALPPSPRQKGLPWRECGSPL